MDHCEERRMENDGLVKAVLADLVKVGMYDETLMWSDGC